MQIIVLEQHVCNKQQSIAKENVGGVCSRKNIPPALLTQQQVIKDKAFWEESWLKSLEMKHSLLSPC